jgi:uncharacterized protein YbaR (Trm112 family)
MGITEEKILNILTEAIFSGIIFLTTSIYSDLIPEIMPALLNISTEIYVKIIVLLVFLLILLCFITILLYQKTREYKPLALKRKGFGYNWSAKISYGGRRDPVDIELQWICPQHKTFLGCMSAEVPETAYHVLWCRKCDRVHPMETGGGPVYLEEAESIVKRNILKKIRIEQKAAN